MLLVRASRLNENQVTNKAGGKTKKSVKSDNYLKDILYVPIPKQIKHQSEVIEIKPNETQHTVFRQLAHIVFTHTTAAHHCLYLFALSDIMNLCTIFYHKSEGRKNPSRGISLIGPGL